MTVRTAKRALNMRGYPEAPIRDITLTDVDFGTTATANVSRERREPRLRNVTANGTPVMT
ncbi:hypothetical protein GCM10009733_078570 [Nonomuraea maheshkhaliensis]|uniref:Uncharacterized protein n=1 Tax=Nonomuraea maheshkhaliensis TaxID=419590 RepID=A0ABP4SBX3_9ACTN